MPKQVLTIQLQCESEEPFNREFLEDMVMATSKFADVLKSQGYTRFEVFLGDGLFTRVVEHKGGV